jgi:hypothetical protein
MILLKIMKRMQGPGVRPELVSKAFITVFIKSRNKPHDEIID